MVEKSMVSNECIVINLHKSKYVLLTWRLKYNDKEHWARLSNACPRLATRVVKINMMCPFCVESHISIRPDMSVTFVKRDARKSLVILELPPLQLAIKNGFWLMYAWRLRIFHCHLFGVSLLPFHLHERIS
jgi:hypothetical protein